MSGLALLTFQGENTSPLTKGSWSQTLRCFERSFPPSLLLTLFHCAWNLESVSEREQESPLIRTLGCWPLFQSLLNYLYEVKYWQSESSLPQNKLVQSSSPPEDVRGKRKCCRSAKSNLVILRLYSSQAKSASSSCHLELSQKMLSVWGFVFFSVCVLEMLFLQSSKH